MTDSFILALRRFKARRGQVKSIHCDNSTNFKGAERKLKQALSKLDENSVEKYLLESLIGWKFNPPPSPLDGLKLRSVVKSVKSAMVYSKSTDKVKTALCRLLFRPYSVDFKHVLVV